MIIRTLALNSYQGDSLITQFTQVNITAFSCGAGHVLKASNDEYDKAEAMKFEEERMQDVL